MLLPFSSSGLRAQSTNASITGRVTDPSKALIADAHISAINAATNFRYETSTNNSGEYYLTNLPPGPYQLELEKSGFKKLIKPDATLHVQDAIELNFELTLGSVTETITVKAGAPLLNTTDATVSTVIDRTFVDNFPLNGRSFQTLILLTPGVVVTATAYDDQGQFSVNGQRADANYFTVDGASANFGVTGFAAIVQDAGGALPAFSASGGTNSLVSVDAMQEFRIQTSSFAPEFGRTPGGQISIVTRSGTNQFHGTAFEYFRNDVLDANDWFSNFNHLPKPAERLNDFGGVFGGPFFKNRTFFFFSYEGLRVRQPSSQETIVPDAASRQQAPASMQPYLNAFPVANGAALGAVLAQFNASYSNPSLLNAYSIRLDHASNSKLSLFGRYNYSPSNSEVRSPYGALSTNDLLSTSIHTFTVGLTHLIKPSISNELRANYSNDRIAARFNLDNFGGAVPLTDAQMYPSGLSSADSLFELLILGAGEFASHQTATFLTQNFSFYAQDTWKLTPRLNVTYGIRWDINTPLKGKNLANQPFAVTGLNDPATLALAPRGTPLYQTTYGNVAPRVGMAYQFSGIRNWEAVLRGGFGIFYDLGYGSVGGASLFFPFNTAEVIAPSSCPSGSTGVCFPLSSQQAARPAPKTNPPVPSINVVDPNLKLPRTYEWNIAVEQSLGASQSISFTYIGADGRDLLRTVNLFNPNPDFQLVQAITNTAFSYYDALQLKYQRRFSRGLQALASYTFSHSTDTASTDAFGTYVNTPTSSSYANVDHGNSDFDIRHSFTAGVTYDLPSPGAGPLRAAFGGWSVDTFLLARSAPPVNILAGLYVAGGTVLYPRPNLVPGVPLELFGSQYPGGKIFNQAAFVAPPSGTQGNFGRNVLRGFGATQADVAFQRRFALTEHLGLRFRAEFFNIFNHPNFGNPNNSLTSPLFGHSTQTLASSLGSGGANGGFNPLYQIGGPRSIQLALKLQF